MRLFIPNDKVVDSGFIPYIVTVLKAYLCEHINKDSFERWDVYFRSSGGTPFTGKTAYDTMLMGIDSIDSTKVNNGFEIGIKNSENSAETVAKLYEACRLMNYGNLTTNGVFLLTSAFEYFNDHMDKYVTHYVGSL